MKVLYASDTHVAPGHLERLLAAAAERRPDALILGGDLVPWRGGTLAEILHRHRRWTEGELLPRLEAFRRAQPGVRVFLDQGNDDLRAARPLLEAADGRLFTLLHRRGADLGQGWPEAG
ncbi:MAG: metallophosphoesterase, partial [Deferrisomatales bacterium]